MKQYTAGPNEDGVRLSRFVLRVTQGLPGSLLYKSFRNKRIKVNGRRAAPDTLLQTGDLVQLYLHDEFFGEPKPAEAPLFPGGLPTFTAVYEDETLAVLYKPPGLLTHADETGAPGLLEAYVEQLKNRGLFSPGDENGFRPAVCTRLDRNTEGLVLLAKTHPALRAANGLLREKALDKRYLCITLGCPPQGVFAAFLRRDKKLKKVEILPQEAPDARRIETEIRVLENAGGLCLCEIGLLTGRTHQIRAHLAYLGTPLLGDAKYGNSAPKGPAYPGSGQALCAYRLCFESPLPQNNPLVHLAGRCFTAPAPALLEWWNLFRQGQKSQPGGITSAAK